MAKKDEIVCRFFVGETPLEELSPENRKAWERGVVSFYEGIVLEEVTKMQERGCSKEEIMRYLAIN